MERAGGVDISVSAPARRRCVKSTIEIIVERDRAVAGETIVYSATSYDRYRAAADSVVVRSCV